MLLHDNWGTATNQSLIIRRYRLGDELGISKLMGIAFSKSYSSRWLQHFHWQQTNPFGRNIRWIAEYDGKIVGHIVRVPLPMKLGEKTLKGSVAADAATHPRFRRRGIYRKLSESSWNEAVRDHILISFADASKMLISPARRYGILDVSEITIMMNPLNPREIVEKRFGQGFFAKTVSHGVESMFKLLSIPRKKAEIRGLKTRRISAFDDDIDVFWNRISPFYGICVARNKTYLNWKYFERRDLSYDVFLVEAGESILGYAVLSARVEDGFKKGFIVDMMTHPSRKDVMCILISQASERLKRIGVGYAECWTLKNSPCHKPLKRHGFFASSFLPRSSLVARFDSSRISEELIKCSGQWYTTYGDFY